MQCECLLGSENCFVQCLNMVNDQRYKQKKEVHRRKREGYSQNMGYIECYFCHRLGHKRKDCDQYARYLNNSRNLGNNRGLMLKQDSDQNRAIVNNKGEPITLTIRVITEGHHLQDCRNSGNNTGNYKSYRDVLVSQPRNYSRESQNRYRKYPR